MVHIFILNMRFSRTLFFGLITFYIFACTPPPSTQLEKNTHPPDTQHKSVSQNQKTNDCVRGIAEPVIIKKVYPKATFILHPDGLTATETLILKNGDKLTIENLGCEYYTLEFHFESTHFEGETSDVNYWYSQAIQRMETILKGVEAPLDLQKGINTLKEQIRISTKSKTQVIRFNQEFDYGSEDMREFVKIHPPEKRNLGTFAIALSFTLGPL